MRIGVINPAPCGRVYGICLRLGASRHELASAKKQPALFPLLLRRVKKAGFRLHLFYLWIPSQDLAMPRIRYRVESGGHNVPERDVRRRFMHSLSNLSRLYRPLLGTLLCFDNSSDSPRLVFRDEAGEISISDAVLYERIYSQFAP